MTKVLWITNLDENRISKVTSIPGYEFNIRSYKEVKDEDYQDAEVIIGYFPPEKVELAKNVKWIQLESAGANKFKNIDENIILTNASGAFGEIISEYMLCFTLLSINKYLDYDKNQKDNQWLNLGHIKSLKEISILSIGMGDIGSSYAKKLYDLGANIAGVRRNKYEKPDYLEALYSFEELEEALPKYDIIALSLPETEETIHLLDYKKLKTMKEGSTIINVGRGSVFITEDLIKVIKENHFKDVFLDVFENEPLPMNNILWNLDNVHITPHITGNYNANITVDKIIDIIKTNLEHYKNNEELENIVDKTIGY